MSFWILKISEVFLLSLAAPFLVFSFFIIVSGWVFKRDKDTTRHILLLLFGVSVLGACAGFSGGMSRIGVVGAIIPAMFTLLGGLAIYLFGVDNSKGGIASLTSSCFAISLLISYTTASQLRNSGDEQRDLRAHCMKVYTNPKFYSADDAAIKKFERLMTKNIRGKKINLCSYYLQWNLRIVNFF